MSSGSGLESQEQSSNGRERQDTFTETAKKKMSERKIL